MNRWKLPVDFELEPTPCGEPQAGHRLPAVGGDVYASPPSTVGLAVLIMILMIFCTPRPFTGDCGFVAGPGGTQFSRSGCNGWAASGVWRAGDEMISNISPPLCPVCVLVEEEEEEGEGDLPRWCAG